MTPDPKESKQTKSQQTQTKVTRFTPLKTNMKPEDAKQINKDPIFGFHANILGVQKKS